MPNLTIKNGDIYLVNYGENAIGHEFKKNRPAVVIQSNEQIKKSNLVTVMPLTTNLENRCADDIYIEKDDENLLDNNSLIKVHNISTFDYQRIYYQIGVVKIEILQKIKLYLKKHFGL